MSDSVTAVETNNLPAMRSFSDYAALSIATCGIGYMPIVPATFGSMVGIALYLLAQKASEYFAAWAEGQNLTAALLESSRASLTIIFLIVLFLIGIWASTRVVKMTEKKDPRIVIIDEVVGQLVTFLFVPAKLGWGFILLGFLAFRFFDILKPYPTYKFEDLPSGLGVMADDAMAGFYAAAFMSLVCTVYLAVF